MTMHSSEGKGQGEGQGGEGRGEGEQERRRGSERIQLEEQGGGGQRSSLKEPRGKLVLIILAQTYLPCLRFDTSWQIMHTKMCIMGFKVL